MDVISLVSFWFHSIPAAPFRSDSLQFVCRLLAAIKMQNSLQACPFNLPRSVMLFSLKASIFRAQCNLTSNKDALILCHLLRDCEKITSGKFCKTSFG